MEKFSNTFTAFAKVNLGLDITSVREDGYHNLDCVTTLIDLYDIVRVSKSSLPSSDYNLTFSKNNQRIYGAELEKINCKKMALSLAEKIRARYATAAVSIKAEVNIPFGVGLGGSSADAGAVAYLMGKLFDIVEIDEQILLSAGADVPFFYHSYCKGGAKRVQGIGSVKDSLPYKQVYIALAWTKTKATTADIFAEFDKGKKVAPVNIENIVSYFTGKTSFEHLQLGNALEESAICYSPNITSSKQCLIDAGFSKVVMTGAGSGFIGIEEDKATFEQKYGILKNIATSDIQIGAYKSIK